MASTGDPTYQTFWERHLMDKEGTMAATTREGIERIISSRTVFHAYEGQIAGYLYDTFRSKNLDVPAVKIFGRVSYAPQVAHQLITNCAGSTNI